MLNKLVKQASYSEAEDITKLENELFHLKQFQDNQ